MTGAARMYLRSESKKDRCNTGRIREDCAKVPKSRKNERGSETSETSPQGMSGCGRNPVSYSPRRKKTLESERELRVNFTCVKVSSTCVQKRESKVKIKIENVLVTYTKWRTCSACKASSCVGYG